MDFFRMDFSRKDFSCKEHPTSRSDAARLRAGRPLLESPELKDFSEQSHLVVLHFGNEWKGGAPVDRSCDHAAVAYLVSAHRAAKR